MDGDITAYTQFKYDTSYGGYPALVRISDTQFFQAFLGSGTDGYAEVFDIGNATVGAITSAATRLKFDNTNDKNNQAHEVEAGKIFVSWNRTAILNDAYAQVFSIDGSDVVTGVGSPLNYSTEVYVSAEDGQNAAVQLSAYKYVMAYWNSTDTQGKITLLDVDSGTFAVTAIGSEGTFDSGGSCKYISGQMISATHFILFWMKSTTAMVARCFSIDLATGVVTALDSEVEFEEANAGNRYIDSARVDASTMVAVWYSGTDARGHARTFNIDGSYAITMDTEYNITSAAAGGKRATICMYDTDKAFVAWQDASNHAWCRAINIGSSSISTISARDVRFYLYSFLDTPRVIKVADYRVVCSWKGLSADGTLQAFDIENAGTVSTFKPQII